MLHVIAAAAAAFSMQNAAEIEANCKAYKAEYGGTVDCTCFAKLVAADDELTAELATIRTPEDLEAASSKMKLTIKACAE